RERARHARPDHGLRRDRESRGRRPGRGRGSRRGEERGAREPRRHRAARRGRRGGVRPGLGMPLMRRLAILLAAAALLLGVRSAGAVCSAPTACQFSDLPASCCGATTCTLDGAITVAGASCNLDFRPYNVTLTSAGTINVGSSMLTIEAGSFVVSGV